MRLPCAMDNTGDELNNCCHGPQRRPGHEAVPDPSSTHNPNFVCAKAEREWRHLAVKCADRRIMEDPPPALGLNPGLG